MITLDPEQRENFVTRLQVSGSKRFYSIALSLGLREGEALGLRFADIDFDGSQNVSPQDAAAISRKRFGRKSKRVFQEPKTDRSRRTLRMSETVVRRLRLHRAQQQSEKLLAGSAWGEHGLVFATTIGTPLEPRSAVRDFKRILEKAQLSRTIRFQDLRHSAASLLLAQGVQLRAIMELLGHSTITLTANTYTHLLPPMMQEMADRMDTVLGG